MKQLTQQQVQQLMMLHQQGQHDKVIQQASSLIQDYPKEFILFNLLGVSLEKQGKLQEATVAYEKALKLNPNIPELQFNLGAMLYAQNRYADAIQHYQKSIQLNAKFVEAYFNLGITYQTQGNFEKAIDAYQQAITIQPGFYEAITNVGTIKQLQGELSEAIELFQKAIAIFEDAKGHYNLAGAFRNQGNLTLAISHFKRAIELGANEPDFYSDLGDALWHDGQIKEANNFLRLAVEKDPDHARANYQLAVFLYDNENYDEARKHFMQSKFEDFQERSLYCLYKLKRFDEFYQQLQTLIPVKNNSPFLATLSTHYAQNFNQEDLYQFCPNPLNYVCHEKIPELVANNYQLVKDLLHDIDTADIAERKQSRLTFGIQSSGNLFRRQESSFQQLADALRLMIKNYHRRFSNESCEFIQAFPKNIEFSSSWFVKMQKGGHLSSHIHEDGWISGAVYLSIPNQNTTLDEGAIELSTHGDNYPKMHDNFPKKTILPAVGDVIFFPSSVFHRTIPFQADKERICIAFDLKPEVK